MNPDNTSENQSKNNQDPTVSITIGTKTLKIKKSLRPGKSLVPTRSWRPNLVVPMTKIETSKNS
ncbi:MAG: hypothetical protein WCG27_08555 [Pseudomonadota bacterium]